MGDGQNRWPAVHRLDAARLYKLVLEKGAAGARYHAVAEEGVPLREIAEAIGRGLKIPTVSLTAEQAGEHFGWLAHFVGLNVPASSALTQERLGWQPTQTGLMDDLDQARDFEPENAGSTKLALQQAFSRIVLVTGRRKLFGSKSSAGSGEPTLRRYPDYGTRSLATNLWKTVCRTQSKVV